MSNALANYTGSSTGLSSYSGGGSSYGLSNFSNGFVQALSCTNMLEQGRAILSGTIMENVGALSAMEGYLCQVAPSGAHRYKAIADAYTAAGIQTIMNFGR